MVGDAESNDNLKNICSLSSASYSKTIKYGILCWANDSIIRSLLQVFSTILCKIYAKEHARNQLLKGKQDLNFANYQCAPTDIALFYCKFSLHTSWSSSLCQEANQGGPSTLGRQGRRSASRLVERCLLRPFPHPSQYICCWLWMFLAG